MIQVLGLLLVAVLVYASMRLLLQVTEPWWKQ